MTTSHTHLIAAYHELLGFRRPLPADVLPSVVGVGAGRCGTTTLYNIFRQSNDIYVPPVKEVNFFGQSKMSRDLYSLYFCGKTTETHACEISPYYLSQKGVAEQIHDLLGPVKIIAQIREPISRFFSHFKHHRAFHKVNEFGEYVRIALDEVKKRDYNASRNWFSPAKAIGQSLYYDNINTYVDVFSPENVLVIDYSEWAHPDRLGRALSGFLGVAISPASIAVSNASDRMDEKAMVECADVLAQFFDDDYQRVLKSEMFMKSYVEHAKAQASRNDV